ncbi:MAG: dihydropteroate synthase [Chloroflexota bacterium]|jgi:5-methyltetrahydrofolate--homocysteine methyltransferase
MITEISSSSKTVTISPDLPTVIIGERINPTARKKLGEALLAGDVEPIRKEAIAQVEAGAHVLDVNVGYPGVDEPKMIKEAVKAVMESVDVPICLDSANPAVMEAALSVYKGKILLSSVTGEAEKMDAILPLVKKYGTAVVALCMDESGIPNDPEEKLAIAKKILAKAESLGIPKEDVIVDCACMTVATDSNAARVTLEAIKLVKQELGCNMTLGASNVSHGLPERKVINSSYLPMVLAAGVNCPIIDPTIPEISKAVLASDLLLGKDEYAMNYIRAYRARQAALESGS